MFLIPELVEFVLEIEVRKIEQSVSPESPCILFAKLISPDKTFSSNLSNVIPVFFPENKDFTSVDFASSP